MTTTPPDSPRSEWGDLVAQLVLDAGFPSMAAFCRRIGVGDSLFRRYLKPEDANDRVVPSPDRVREIEAALGVTLPAPPPKLPSTQRRLDRLDALEARVARIEQQEIAQKDLLETIRSALEDLRSQR